LGYRRQTAISNAFNASSRPMRAFIDQPTTGASSEPRYEVLIRMLDTEGSVIPPGAFMPATARRCRSRDPAMRELLIAERGK
jgi:hypothetical protein